MKKSLCVLIASFVVSTQAFAAGMFKCTAFVGSGMSGSSMSISAPSSAGPTNEISIFQNSNPNDPHQKPQLIYKLSQARLQVTDQTKTYFGVIPGSQNSGRLTFEVKQAPNPDAGTYINARWETYNANGKQLNARDDGPMASYQCVTAVH